MPIPNLLHPTAITIQVLSRTTTIQDDDYREPVQQADRGADFVCPGQVAWTSDELMNADTLGANESSAGYIVFRLADLRAITKQSDFRLKQNDRFLKLGTGPNAIEVDLYITDLRYGGHWPDQGGATIVKAFFKDRFPSKQNRGGVSG